MTGLSTELKTVNFSHPSQWNDESIGSGNHSRPLGTVDLLKDFRLPPSPSCLVYFRSMVFSQAVIDFLLSAILGVLHSVLVSAFKRGLLSDSDG